MWRDGSSYKGRWEDNKMAGFGCYTWADKKQCTVEWINAKMSGFGVYQWADGKRYEGFYTRDKR